MRPVGLRGAGFTLVEGLIAAALAIVVLGGGIYLYVQGNKMFHTTTEHSSIREEALLILEKINRILRWRMFLMLENLQVSD